MTNLAFYGSLLGDIKIRIRQAQARAAVAAKGETAIGNCENPLGPQYPANSDG